MKCRILILASIMFLLAANLASAQNNVDYSKYKGMSLVYSIGSELSVEKLGQDFRVLEAEAVVKLFPRKHFEGQTLKSYDIDSKPDAEVDMNEVLRFKWGDSTVDRMVYKLDARVDTTNRFAMINRKINFPYNFNDDDIEKYIKATEFIDLNEDIRNTAGNVVAGESDYYIAVAKIANWVKENINYNLNTMTEKAVQKSSWVLVNKQGVCDEITNLFISMLRSAGIPARFVSGSAYTNMNNKWGNHGWAEVYFPGFGWVNYDVTYGQYGWIDPSHLKLSDTYDSGETSVSYKWRVRDANIKAKDLTINTMIGGLGGLMDSQILIEVAPVYKEAGFGSFVPVQVIVSNLKNYYVSESVALVKAPKMLDTINKIIFLKPSESRIIYWVVEIPENLDPDYVFSAVLKAEGNFGESAESNILISAGAKVHTYEEAVQRAYELEHMAEKGILENIEMKCSSYKAEYYSNEKIEVGCLIANAGGKILDLKICLEEDCKKAVLGMQESRKIDFESYGIGKKTVVAESDEFVKYANVAVEIIELPDIYISDLNPREAGYSENANLTFRINSDFTAYNVHIEIEGFSTLHLEKLKGEQVIVLPAKGKELLKGMHVKMSYSDVKGKAYEKDEVYFVEVKNVPWHRKALMFFGI